VTLLERAAAFARVFHDRPASHLQLVREQDHEVLYGRWVIGPDYRNKTKYYGAYPAGYIERVMALFPDVESLSLGDSSVVLHVFSGSLPPGNYERCDSHQPAELQCSVYNLPNRIWNFKPWLVLADPPYSAADAEHYGTAMVDRRRAMAALAQVTRVGGHLVWLDTVWPMHRKADWRTVGRIALTRSTNHRIRDISIFERVA